MKQKRMECVCDGSGWYRVDVEPGHKLFGRLLPCPACRATWVRDMAAAGVGVGGLQPEEIAMSWDDVKKVNSAPAASDIIRKEMEAGYGFVVLVGPPGQGKTLLMKIAVAVALNSGWSARYSTLSRLLDDLRATYDGDNPQAGLHSKMSRLIAYDLLAVDEIDKISGTPWAQERFFSLVDERYQAAILGRALTIMAANTENFPEYVKSRMMDARCRFIRMSGQDARPVVPETIRF